jgi:NAD(P)-dependent dehydrogenase (short-subunit alcohol dehydrogenase family)
MDLWACPAVVTGAASGLGAETARYLTEAGAKVTVIDIDAEGVRKLADEIGAHAIPCDVADAQSAEQALAMAAQSHGAARVLVHCVGRGHFEPILGSGGPMPLEDFRQLVEVNLISTFNMMRLAAADMAGCRRWPTASAASSCRRRRSRPTKDRAARRPIRPRRAASSA